MAAYQNDDGGFGHALEPDCWNPESSPIQTWANTIASNNDAPHAPWWEHAPAAEPSYNPTACLIAFILKFADRESRLFTLACGLAKEAYIYFKAHFPMESVGNVSCFVKLYNYLKENATDALIDLTEFKALLQRQI